MVRPDNASKRNQARIIAATGQADIDAQQRALAEEGQEALYREQVAQQLAANRVNLERRKEAGQISQTQYDQQLKQQQDMVERNSQFYGKALKSSVDAGVSRHRASDRASGQIGESHRFYREIGYSQYAGRYAPFEIPEGHEVRGITEGPEGLNITFVDPVAEQQAKSQAMASDMFYKSIGFGQFGGKYAPFEVPKGLKVKNITEGPTGLNIEFYDPEFEASQAASHAFFSSIGYSQFAGKYAPFEVPAGHTVQSITESESGLNITFLGPQTSASTPTSQAAASTPTSQASELSNIEKVIMGDLTIDFLSDAEKQELYMITSSQSMAPLMAFRDFTIQQSKTSQKGGFTDVLKEGKAATTSVTIGTTAGGILKSIEKADASVTQAAVKTLQPKNVFEKFISDPIGAIGGALNASETIGKIQGGATGAALQASSGVLKSIVNVPINISNTVLGVTQGRPAAATSQIIPRQSVLASQYQPATALTSLTPTSEISKEAMHYTDIGINLAAAAAIPAAGPAFGVSAGSIVAAEVASVGLSTGVKAYLTHEQAQKAGLKLEASDYLLTPKEASLAAAEGGLFALAFGVVFKAPLKQVQTKMFGAKATEITGATEFSQVVTKGQKTFVDRFTLFDTKTVRLKGADLEYYSRYNLQTLQKARLDMAGTQNIKTVKLDVAGFPEEITVFGKAAESTRSANPVLAALKGERLAYGKVGQYTRGISKTTIKAQGPIKAAGKTTTKPSTILQKDIVVDPAYIVDRAPLQMSTRKFTTMKASGLVDEAGTVDLAKSLPTGMAQEIYKKMGGGYKQLKASNYIQSLNEPKSSAMKAGSNKFFRENFVKQPKISTTSFAKPIQETKLSLKPTLKEVTLTRAILKVDSASKVKSVIPVIDAKPVLQPAKTETKQVISAKEKQSPYPHRTSQQLRQIEDEEQVYLSYPGQQLRVETPTKTVVTPVLTPRSTYLQTSAVTLPTMTQIRTQPVTAPTKEKTKTPTLIRPITTPKTAPLTTPVITPWQTPKTAPYSTPFFGQTQKLTPKQMTTTALQFPSPATTKTLTAPAPFTPPFSHQKPRKRTRGIFGLWRKQDNPVKTSAAMLKTFGLLGSKKPVKSKRKKSRR